MTKGEDEVETELRSVPSLDMQIVHQNPSHHHVYPPRDLANMFASFYYCESNRIPIVSCLRCAVEKTEGRDVSERCERPVVEREGGNWKVRECWKVKMAWDEDLIKRERGGDFGHLEEMQ